MSEPLLMSKCRVPSACRAPIPRPRLLERFPFDRGARVIVVSAPAGFGKTTLVAEWARSTRDALAWLSLDELDNDPHRFWSYFSGVLDSVLRDRGDNVRRMRTRHGEPVSPADAVAHRLERLTSRCDLVIDDFHFLEAESVLATVNRLLRRVPDRCRLVLISRDRPRLALSRLRLRGELEEITARSLRFTRKEVVQLFREDAGCDLTREQASALRRATEGWPAGLRLALLSYKERGGSPEGILEEGWAGRYAFDYLAEEVFERQDEDLRRFLMLTSVLRRFCAPLCVAVTGIAESGRYLRHLERSNLFLLSLGGELKWYRYHRLFGRFLRARLEETASEGIEELHRRAADWYESNGFLEGALLHAAASGHRERLLRLATLVRGEPLRRNLADALLASSESAPEQELLSRRELDVLRLLAQGDSNKEMARRLGISSSTVKTHLSHIYEKLGAHNRTQAVGRARRLALLDDPAGSDRP